MSAEHGLDLAGLLDVVGQADDPLLLGLRLAGAMQGQQRLAFLSAALARFPHWGAEAAREMTVLAAALQAGDPVQAQSLQQALEGAGPAATLMRALLLEVAGCPEQAAALLAAVPDHDPTEGRALRLLAQARNLVRSQAPLSEISWTLREAARAAVSYRSLCAVDRLLGRLQPGSLPAQRHVRLALLGTGTLELWAPALRAACYAAGIDAEVHSGAFGQCQQEILAPDSPLDALRPTAIIIALDWRAIGLPAEAADPEKAVAEAVAALRALWRTCRERWGALVFQYNLEVPPWDANGSLSAILPGGRGRLLRRINLALWDAAAAEPGVHILDLEQCAAVHGKAVWSDPALWHTARQYPAPEALPALARRQAAMLRAALGLSAKCLALDLDGTLWGGVIGEDGLKGIILGGNGIGEAYVEFQRYVQALAQRGIILAVISKNNEQDALLPFQQHPEMVLKLDDIAVFQANWQPKDENLRQAAQALNIGLESIVFVDDNPLERAWMRRQLPQVEVPELPADPALYVRTLDAQMAFEALSLTAEDRERATAYHGNIQRSALQRAATSLEEFLAALQMTVELQPFTEANLPRIVQLINKTNQFNLTTRRLTEAEVRALMATPGCYTQSMRLRDRFGDNGLTGVLIARPEGSDLRIDLWLLSCRVMGRRVEEVMLAAVARFAQALGCRRLIGEYWPTAKNSPVRDLYDRLGFTLIHQGGTGERRYQWDLRQPAPPWPQGIQINDWTQHPYSGVAPRLEVNSAR